MRFIKPSTCCLVLSLFSAAIYAAQPEQSDNPSDYGFFVGAGGSYNTIDYDAHMVGTPSVRNATQKFAPVLQLGYFGELTCGSPYRWGAKLFYKYLDFEHIPSGVNGLGTSFEMTNEYGAVVMVGRHCPVGVVYGAFGATWFNQEFGYTMAQGMRSESENKFGFTAQFGMTYALSCDVFLDVNYSYHHIPESSFSIDPTVKTKACATVQEVMITLNKSFNFF